MDFDPLIVDTIVKDDNHHAGDEFKTLLTLQQNFDLLVRDRHKKFSKNIPESNSPLIFLFCVTSINDVMNLAY